MATQNKRRRQIDVPMLFRLWTDKTLEVREIASRLNVSASTVIKEASRRGLSKRRRQVTTKAFDDSEPTPEMIAEYERRKAEVREKHLADMRSKP
jgi:Mn-dependent DtxR family transcriptional regulator